MTYFQRYLVFLIALILLSGCQKYSEHEKFQRPDWLPGKLYTSISVKENLSLFAECLRITGLDTILDVSGSWSVFAPTDEAMQNFLSENQYAGIADIPFDELEKLTEFHIVQNPWSYEQLQSLSAYGWRTRNDSKKYSYAYKRQTILHNPVEKYWIRKKKDQEMIVLDSLTSDRYKKVYVQTRKNIPIFYDAYLNINNISSADFRFYFDRPYEQGNVYYGGAKIIEADIFAENGFVHIIDKVVTPMLNAQELLERDLPNESYKLFLEFVFWYYPSFEPNMTATYNQPEAKIGGLADTIWDLNFYDLNFALHKEHIGNEGPEINESWVRHNGLFAPTDNAFSKFVDGILTAKSGFPRWKDIYNLPPDIVELIVERHFKVNPIYPSTTLYNDIFRGKGGFKQNEGSIIRKEFGSNCTFIGIDNYIPDRVFTSVTGPVFCRPDYSLFRQALLYSDTHNTLANHEGDLYFFPIPDYALRADSSLILNWIDRDENRYNFVEYNRQKRMIEYLSPGAVKNRILNQVGTSMPDGSANKEFIRTLGGNYITWDHTNNTIQGTIPSTIGYTGDSIVINSPVPIDEPADNGKVWRVRYWFRFGNRSMQSVLSEYTTFNSLLKKAGLVDEGSSKILFMDQNEQYTIFIPTNEALANSRADTLNVVELRKFLKNHFLSGEIIFTDNKQPSGNYYTSGGEMLNVRTGPDVIEIPDKTGNPYVVISEKEAYTNIMISEHTTVSAVVHEIDKVLINF
jgi:uncharacterized surface protein with fasciclin (FAS1) repeats